MEVKVNPHKVLIEIDKPEGITIYECTSLSKFLSNEPSLNTFFESHELEVSSPGIDRPLRVREQYRKNIGRKIKLKTTEGIELSGKLISVTSEGIEIEEPAVKKISEEKKSFVLFDVIREARIIITFN